MNRPNHETIRIQGACEHNLDNVDVEIPRDQLTVVTGLSGSGKSSLAFDTIYREGQRRYLESLSAYARQFLGQVHRPAVDSIEGLSPTLCIDQKTVNRNPRSTVGTITEVLDHLRLLMARLGTPHCPVCQREISRSSPEEIAAAVLREAGDDGKGRLWVMAPIVQDRKGEYRRELADALADGFVRARIDEQMRDLDQEIQLARYEKHTIELVVDRLRGREERKPRLTEAIEHALRLTDDSVSFLVQKSQDETPTHRLFSAARTCPVHGVSFPELEPRLFSFNAPQGMCERCSGIGWLEDFDPHLLLDPEAPPSLTLRPLQKKERIPFSSLSREVVDTVCRKLDIPTDALWNELSSHQQEQLLNGADVQYQTTRESGGRRSTSTRTWAGFLPATRHIWHFTRLPSLAPFRRRVVCPDCDGKRLNPMSLSVLFREHSIGEFTEMTIEQANSFFSSLTLQQDEQRIGNPIIRELKTRFAFLHDVGLGYLNLNRSAATLSGGEGQRIRLAAQVGTGLQGITYVLDEPSIGLHLRDQMKLTDALLELRDRGNTVIVVEHDPNTMERADFIIEIGPGAGRQGGRIVAADNARSFWEGSTLTARFLRGEESIAIPTQRRAGNGQTIRISGASQHNLKNVDVSIPLGTLTVVTGVSGSGKSTLISETLVPVLANQLHRAKRIPGAHQKLEGLEHLEKVVEVDQSPIGRTPRSNPATYTKAFDAIRTLFAQVPESRARGYKKGRFSFNVKGGRCEECAGAGVKTIEMQFLSSVSVTCEACNGRRFNQETLDIRLRGRTITDVLNMQISEAVKFFSNHRRLHRILKTLESVGLGYLSLGQPSTTLSGGEAQRIKLASELHRPTGSGTLIVLDEPSTGLHMADVRLLLKVLQRLVDNGNSVIVIEHDTDVIKVADHVIDLGPDGGDAGGNVVGTGTPEQIAALDTPTAQALHPVFVQTAPSKPSVVQPSRPDGNTRSISLQDIQLNGVSTHNLKNLSVSLPKGQLTVITGPSGSGKSSLAFHTLFAEGQRRYVESLSTYARRFLGQMKRPTIESATGLAPAIAIDQRNRGHNPRSTVATTTEIYDVLRILYAKVGAPTCPECDSPLKAWSPTGAAIHLAAINPGRGWLATSPDAGFSVGDLLREGFARCLTPSHQEVDLQEEVEKDPNASVPDDWMLVVDRLDPATADRPRLHESVALAYGFGNGRALFLPKATPEQSIVLTREADCPTHGRIWHEAISPRHFSFNSHIGACEGCDGLGRRMEIRPELVIPKPHRDFPKAIDGRVGAVILRSPSKRALVRAVLTHHGSKLGMPPEQWSEQLHHQMFYGTPMELPIKYKRKWGNSITEVTDSRSWPGIVSIVNGWKGNADWLRSESECTRCKGGRLRARTLAVTIGALNIAEACRMTVEEAHHHWVNLELTNEQTTIAAQAVQEVSARLKFLCDVGLGYLTLDRSTTTLSGGESQRIRLATQLGTQLTGAIYVLDEPTIGLHHRDTQRLLNTLNELRDLGNTVVVVEHDETVIRTADHVVDLGPGAGEFGGQIVAEGTPKMIMDGDGATGDYLSGRTRILDQLPHGVGKRGPPKLWVQVPPSSVHNLKQVEVRFPRRRFTAVTGVSGSGKTTLVMSVLAEHFPKRLRRVIVDQRPIGRTPRSTPATFCKVLGPIRKLLASTPEARAQGFKPGRFSFNSPQGGRCVHCEGRGATLVEMHFLSDVWVPCPICKEQRFDEATLAIKWRGHSIGELLQLSVEQSLQLFESQPGIHRRLRALFDVGLGYLRLGQPATTLSGGEAQRMKLAAELMGRKKETCFFLDEPTTGLHFTDVEKLLTVLHRLVDEGHMVVVIEHHLDLIHSADHIIDLGPEGGEKGGQIIAEGTPAAIMKVPESWTGRALGEHLRV